jgi:exonuclease VII small subunit
MTPIGIEQQLVRVAGHLRKAQTELEQSYQQAPAGSDLETRCHEALKEIESTLVTVEWEPSEEPQS